MSFLILAAATAMSLTPEASVTKALNMAVVQTPAARSHDETMALRAIGIARTSIDKDLGASVKGSLGFLCGRQAGQGDQGGASAYGYDPNGRFVGAKLSIGF